MNSKWTGKDFGITAGISLVYFMITMVVMMSGALTPILWIFMPALIGFFTGIPYLYIVAKEAKPGVVFLIDVYKRQVRLRAAGTWQNAIRMGYVKHNT